MDEEEVLLKMALYEELHMSWKEGQVLVTNI